MKKLFLVCLMLLAGSVWAEWIKADESEEAQFFYDPSTIRIEGKMRRVWRLQNLKQRGQYSEMSRRMRMEYDCMNERSRILADSFHSEPMAGGKTLHSDDTDDIIWREIPPGTIAAVMLQIVCSK
jgi:hypothetical protein